jgi:hypothetical protein
MNNELSKRTQLDLTAYYRNFFAQFLDALYVILGITKKKKKLKQSQQIFFFIERFVLFEEISIFLIMLVLSLKIIPDHRNT